MRLHVRLSAQRLAARTKQRAVARRRLSARRSAAKIRQSARAIATRRSAKRGVRRLLSARKSAARSSSQATKQIVSGCPNGHPLFVSSRALYPFALSDPR